MGVMGVWGYGGEGGGGVVINGLRWSVVRGRRKVQGGEEKWRVWYVIYLCGVGRMDGWMDGLEL